MNTIPVSLCWPQMTLAEKLVDATHGDDCRHGTSSSRCASWAESSRCLQRYFHGSRKAMDEDDARSRERCSSDGVTDAR